MVFGEFSDVIYFAWKRCFFEDSSRIVKLLQHCNGRYVLYLVGKVHH